MSASTASATHLVIICHVISEARQSVVLLLHCRSNSEALAKRIHRRDYSRLYSRPNETTMKLKVI